MKSLYKSKFQEVTFDVTKSILENVWTEYTALMQEQEYKTEMMELSSCFMKHLPEKQLIDTRKFNFPIAPDMQEWTDENILKPHSKSSKLKKVAFIVSQEIFSQVSVEQTMDEEHGRLFNTHYFEDRASAIAWLS